MSSRILIGGVADYYIVFGMNKLRMRIHGIRVFFDEVLGEIRKSTWPERQDLIESTIVVIVSVLMLSVFVGMSDKLLVIVLRFLIPSS